MRKPLLFILLATAAGLAQAHTGHGADGFVHGFGHPFSGLDHLLAMFAVGLWSAQLGGHARWQGPALFVLMLAAGAALGAAGIALPWLESGIALSVLLSGLLVAALARPPRLLAMAAIAAFALYHGVAHGLEMPADASGAAYAAGFMLASALLHIAGVAVGQGTLRSAMLLRALGAAIAASGALLLVGTL